MNASNPLVSVVIPTYNASGTILRALESVWRQDYEPMEVIVVDDASTDETRNKVESRAGGAVQLIMLDRNAGASAARNIGIEAARGEYVAFLDADDEWLLGKIRKQVDLIESDPKIYLVTCDQITVIDGIRTVYTDSVFEPMVCGAEAWRALLAYSFIDTSCVMARRKALLEVGGFDDRLVVAEDQDLWIKLALRGEVGCLYEVLMLSHNTPGSLMKSHPRGAKEFLLPMIERHIKEQKDRLSNREIREILGRRYASVGKNLYVRGYSRDGFALVLQAMLNGYRPLENLGYLVVASPPVRVLKRWLRGCLVLNQRGRARP